MTPSSLAGRVPRSSAGASLRSKGRIAEGPKSRKRELWVSQEAFSLAAALEPRPGPLPALRPGAPTSSPRHPGATPDVDHRLSARPANAPRRRITARDKGRYSCPPERPLRPGDCAGRVRNLEQVDLELACERSAEGTFGPGSRCQEYRPHSTICMPNVSEFCAGGSRIPPPSSPPRLGSACPADASASRTKGERDAARPPHTSDHTTLKPRPFLPWPFSCSG